MELDIMSEFKELTDEELENVTGGTNWPKFGQCMMEHGCSNIPSLSNITQAITDKDWSKVKELSLQAAIKDLPIVSKCFESS